MSPADNQVLRGVVRRNPQSCLGIDRCAAQRQVNTGGPTLAEGASRCFGSRLAFFDV